MMQLDLSNIFDRVVVINLARRADRLRTFQSQIQLAEWPFKPPQVFTAIDGALIPKPVDWSDGNGAWGCLLSHRSVLQSALLDGCESILVLEDDACFRPTFIQEVQQFFERVPTDWDGLMLGGQHLARPISVVPGVVRCLNCQRTHAYAARGRFLSDLYQLLVSNFGHCDHLLGPFAAHYSVYAPEPFIVGQSDGPSDIINGDMPVRYWSVDSVDGSALHEVVPPVRHSVRVGGPIMLLKSTPSVALALSNAGFYFGDEQDRVSGADRGLTSIMGLPTAVRHMCLAVWLRELVTNALARGAVPTLYHPTANLGPLRELTAEPIYEVEADTVASAASLWERLSQNSLAHGVGA